MALREIRQELRQGDPRCREHRARTPARGLFHVVNDGACSRYEFAKAIVRGAVQVTPISSAEAGRPAPRPENSSLISLRWPAVGIPPLRSWQAALNAFLDSPM
ncbi:MAG: sugar nucleotide-binding protein [Chloroflexi bacterium]|nr:MAG: sugar nucleotide-binding protein [Chloroflexota bacterium]